MQEYPLEYSPLQKENQQKKVWFHDMTMNGYSFDDKRTFIGGKGDIPDIITQFNKRYKEPFDDRKAKCFFIPIDEIIQNSYDLSISKYKEREYEEVEYEKTRNNQTKNPRTRGENH
jgi:type I restriction enzyme M protein